MAKNKNNTVKVNNTTVPANPKAENKNTTVKNTKNARIFVSGRTITIDDAIKKKKERDERIDLINQDTTPTIEDKILSINLVTII